MGVKAYGVRLCYGDKLGRFAAALTRALCSADAVDQAAVLAHYGRSQSLRDTADAFGLSPEGVRQIVLRGDPRALRLWGANNLDNSPGVMRGRSTLLAIGTQKGAKRTN